MLSPEDSKSFWRRIGSKVMHVEWALTIAGMLFLVWLYFFLNSILEPVYHIHCAFDDYIPFVDIFGLPYVYWFAYIPISVVYMLWHFRDNEQSRKDFFRYIGIVYGGWFVVCLLFVLFPSTIDFRPTEFPLDNFCAKGLAWGFSFDRPVNVIPSLHCYSTLAIALGVCLSSSVRESRFSIFHYSYNLFFAILICASTVLVKQHSILDFFASALLVAVMYLLVYQVNYKAVYCFFRKIWSAVVNFFKKLGKRVEAKSRMDEVIYKSARCQNRGLLEYLLPPC